MNRPPPRNLTAALLALLILAGAFLRVRLALDRPLWDDELWQRFVTREGSYLDFVLWRHDELVHPPLSFILNKLCCDLFKSDAAWVWRLPSLLAGILCIPAGFALGKKLGSSALALGVAAMLACDLNTAWESANARMYSMLALEIVAALCIAIPLLNSRETLWRRAALLGVVLAAMFWTHMLAVLPWCALGLSAVVFAFRKDARQPFVSNLAIAFGFACLLGVPGILRFFAVREGVGAAVPDRTFGEVMHLLYWVTNLLVWIEVRLVSPLVLTLSVFGAFAMFRRSRATSLLLLALGLMTGLSQIHLLHTHPFSVMRYFIPAQPVLWIGLPFLFLIAPPPRLRAIAAAVFCLFVAVQSWNCTRLEFTYGTVASNVRESRVFVDAVAFVKDNKSSADAVTYLPHDRYAYRGEYFGLPASESLGGPAQPAPPRFPHEPRTPPPLDAPASWIVERVSPRAENSRDDAKVFDRLIKHYHPGHDGPDALGASAEHWLVTRIDRSGITTRAFSIE